MCSLLISLVAFYANTSHFPFDNDDGRLLQYQHHVSVTLTLLWWCHRPDHSIDILWISNVPTIITRRISSQCRIVQFCAQFDRTKLPLFDSPGVNWQVYFRSLSDKQLFWGNTPRNAFSSSKSKPWFGWGFWFWSENISKITKIGNFLFSWSFHKICFSLWHIVKHLNWSNFRWEAFWTFEEEEVAATVKLLHGVQVRVRNSDLIKYEENRLLYFVNRPPKNHCVE